MGVGERAIRVPGRRRSLKNLGDAGRRAAGPELSAGPCAAATSPWAARGGRGRCGRPPGCAAQNQILRALVEDGRKKKPERGADRVDEMADHAKSKGCRRAHFYAACDDEAPRGRPPPPVGHRDPGARRGARVEGRRPSYSLADVSIEQLGELCELQHRGVNPGL
jgi:hypothetical protein